MAIPFDSVLITDPARGCATKLYKTTIQWPDLAPGKYPFWVTVDGGNLISEGPPGQLDNLGSGMVSVYKVSTFLPVVARK